MSRVSVVTIEPGDDLPCYPSHIIHTEDVSAADMPKGYAAKLKIWYLAKGGDKDE